VNVECEGSSYVKKEQFKVWHPQSIFSLLKFLMDISGWSNSVFVSEAFVEHDLATSVDGLKFYCW
jgi:hypothetical protein